MNIRECIEQQLDKQMPVDPYFQRIRAVGTTQIARPKNIAVDRITVPMTRNNVSFEYALEEVQATQNLGQFLADVYYPVGDVITVMGRECTILNYGQAMNNPYGVMKGYSVDVLVEYKDNIPVGTKVSNEVVEADVLNALTTMVLANKHIHELLPGYNQDPIAIIGNPDGYQALVHQAVSLCQTINDRIIYGLYQNVKASSDTGNISQVQKDVDDMTDYIIGAPSFGMVGPYGTEAVNGMAFVNFLSMVADEHTTEKYAKLISVNHDLITKFVVKKTDTHIFVLVKTPDPARYDAVLIINYAGRMVDVLNPHAAKRIAYINKNHDIGDELDLPVLFVDALDGEETTNSWRVMTELISLLAWQKNTADTTELIPTDYYAEYVLNTINALAADDGTIHFEKTIGCDIGTFTLGDETVTF